MISFDLLTALRSQMIDMNRSRTSRTEHPVRSAGDRWTARRLAAKPLALRRRYYSWHLPRRNQIGR